MSIILDEAKKVVYERNATYGQPEDNFAITAELWSAYLGVTIKPEDVGMMMILLKVAREKYQHKHDNLVDIAGYAECVARLNQKGQQRFNDNGDDPLLNVMCAGCQRVVPEKFAVFSNGVPYCLRCNEDFSTTGG